MAELEARQSSQGRALSSIFLSARKSERFATSGQEDVARASSCPEGTPGIPSAECIDLLSILATGGFGRGMAALLNREGLHPGRSPSSNWSEDYQNLRDQAARASSVAVDTPDIQMPRTRAVPDYVDKPAAIERAISELGRASGVAEPDDKHRCNGIRYRSAFRNTLPDEAVWQSLITNPSVALSTEEVSRTERMSEVKRIISDIRLKEGAVVDGWTVTGPKQTLGKMLHDLEVVAEGILARDATYQRKEEWAPLRCKMCMKLSPEKPPPPLHDSLLNFVNHVRAAHGHTYCQLCDRWIRPGRA